MKNFLFQIGALLICSMFLFTACETDDDDDTGTSGSTDTTNNCGDVSNSVVEFYEDDAVRLAVQLANSQGGAASASVIIPPALIEDMSNVLTAVHASEFIARDSVVDVYDVHIFDGFSLDKIVVGVSTDTSGNAWVQKWLNGNRLTGNAEVDALMSTFSLDVDQVLELGESANVILVSEDPINTAALINQFSFIEGVADVGQLRTETGDGDNIIVTPVAGDADSYNVVYEVSYDDCENGCQKTRSYEFGVNDNCTVSYINTFGDDAPEDTDPSDRHE